MSVRYNLVPRFIHNEYQQQNYAGHFYAHTMFMDISGFTAMTEALMQQGKVGAEILSNIVNQVFEPVIETVYNNGGFISTFAGDAFTSIFPTLSPQITNTTILQVATAIQYIFKQSGLKHTKIGDFQLAVKIGLGIGEIKWGIVGPPNHKAFLFSGQGIIDCAQAEANCEQGEIILSKAFQEAIPTPVKQNRFEWQTAPPSIENNTSFKPLKNISLEIGTKFYPERILTAKTSGEFREVVSVFISFQGVDTLTELDKFVSTVITHLDRFGGYFARLDFGDKGNTLLIFFGCPIAYENNIERAFNFVISLKSIISSIKDLVNLNWRAGITAGTMYAGVVGIPQRCEYTVLGTSVNLSARLMMKANWGELLITQSLANYPHFAIKYKGDFYYKGIKHPVATYCLLTQQLTYQHLYPNLMINRETELQRLQNIVQPIFSGHFGGVVYVYGEAGIGKSHLMFELRRSLTNIIWFTCQAENILQQPFNPFIYALKTYFDLQDNLPIADRKAKFELKFNDLMAQLGKFEDNPNCNHLKKELIRTQSMLGALVGLHWDDSLYEKLEARNRHNNTLTALKDFFLAHTFLKPVIIEVEDIQWLDNESLHLIEIITQHIENYPLLIVATSRYRDDGSEPKLFIQKDLPFPIHSINLNRLSNSDLRLLAEYELEKAISDQLFELLLNKTQANPFFAQQILRYLQEEDALKWNNNRWELATQALTIPSSINSLLIARLDRLPPNVKEVVEIAAIIGREFEVDILTHILKKPIHNQIDLGTKEQIWSPLTEIHFTFKQALLQDAAYEMQLKARLKKLHYQVAETIKTLYIDNLEEKYADIAFHYEHADDIKEAIYWYEVAAKQAQETYANEITISRYNHVLELITKLKPKERPQFELTKLLTHQSLGNVLYRLGHNDKALKHYTTAWKMLNPQSVMPLQISETDKIHHLATLSNQIAEVHIAHNNYRKAFKWLQKGINCLNPNQPSLELIEIYLTMAALYYRQGKYNKVIHWSNKALPIASEIKPPDRQKTLGRTYALLGLAHLDLGNYPEAIELCKKSVDFYTQIDYILGQAYTLYNLGYSYFTQGNWEKALEVCQQSLAINQKTGAINVQANIINLMGMMYFNRGEWIKAIEFYQQSLSIWQQVGRPSLQGLLLSNLAQVYLAQNEYAKAQTALEQSEALFAQLDSNPYAAQLSRYWAILYLKNNRFNLALNTINRSINLALKHKAPLQQCQSLQVLGDIHLTQDEYNLAKIALDQSLKLATTLTNNYEIAKTKLLLAKWAIKTTLFDQTNTYLTQAIKTFQEIGAKADLDTAKNLATQLKTLTNSEDIQVLSSSNLKTVKIKQSFIKKLPD